VNEDRLWAPWRIDYVRSASGPDKPPQAPLPAPSAWREGAERGCFLCQAAAQYEQPSEINRRLLVVERGENSLIVLNRYPYNNGHALVAPLRHVGELDELTDEAHVACIQQLSRLIRVYRRSMNAEGFNIGLNLGRVAGAGVPGHLHWHLVPRWAGDHNFMPVLAGTHVIPQALDALWELLNTEWSAGE
jgi:ATP adenylyltransferase